MMITLSSPHPYVPPAAVMLALALLFGVTIFLGTGGPNATSGGLKR